MKKICLEQIENIKKINYNYLKKLILKLKFILNKLINIFFQK